MGEAVYGPNVSRAAQALRRADILWLALAVLLLVGSGIGLRDPWPADEPRFAAIARDMVASGDWLVPRVGGDLYQDKPPLYFWLLAAAYALTGSIRWSFLLPSLLSACGILWLTYDLARRMAGRAAALAGTATLTLTVQFVLTMRSAQIDAALCLLTTLSLYGLLRHLLFGPAWGWYALAGLAAGLGVITKGVGFLPLLVLAPYAWLRRRGFEPLAQIVGGPRWLLAGAGFLLGVGVWLVPMLVAAATRGDPALAAYRDEILFQQTVERYAFAWHHVRPWYYFLLEVVPPLWLPLSPLLVWLAPRWREAFQQRDARVWLPLAWVLVVLLFFSLSTGKRGIYILPALPALVLAAAPSLPELYRRRGVRLLGLALAALLVVVVAMLIAAQGRGVPAVLRTMEQAGLDSIAPLAAFALFGLVTCVLAWRTQPLLAWPALLTALTLVWSYVITPQIDAHRSGRAFIQRVLEELPRDTQLGLVAYKEQFLLYLDRPIVNFGHSRWREGPAEAYDAARWLNAAPSRVLLIPQTRLAPCFEDAPRVRAGTTAGDRWFLVRPPAARACVERGNPTRAITYDPAPR